MGSNTRDQHDPWEAVRAFREYHAMNQDTDYNLAHQISMLREEIGELKKALIDSDSMIIT